MHDLIEYTLCLNVLTYIKGLHLFSISNTSKKNIEYRTKNVEE